MYGGWPQIYTNLENWSQNDTTTITSRVTHQLEDKDHLFQVHTTGTETQVSHPWASNSQIVPWDRDQSTLQEAIANLLEVGPKTTWIVPHPEIHRILPLWAGKRRWTQTRARYKKLINSKRSSAAVAALERVKEAWKRQHTDIAAALEKLHWKDGHRLRCISAYQHQTVMRMKWNRLRLWAGAELGLRCSNPSCYGAEQHRTAHLIWRYPWARKVWTEMIQDWQSGNEQHGRNSDRLLGDIFGLRLRQTPDWLVVWAKDRPTDLWDRLHAVGQDLWRLGCVTIFTAIWRWNVEQVHGDNAKRTYQAAQRHAHKGRGDRRTRPMEQGSRIPGRRLDEMEGGRGRLQVARSRIDTGSSGEGVDSDSRSLAVWEWKTYKPVQRISRRLRTHRQLRKRNGPFETLVLLQAVSRHFRFKDFEDKRSPEICKKPVQKVKCQRMNEARNEAKQLVQGRCCLLSR
ncbi:hypothetical protein GQ600_18572 [Phytophthora cactorum]|nr:hypothetical protein GQ600_18572 [Phytophthora cactorum]